MVVTAVSFEIDPVIAADVVAEIGVQIVKPCIAVVNILRERHPHQVGNGGGFHSGCGSAHAVPEPQLFYNNLVKVHFRGLHGCEQFAG